MPFIQASDGTDLFYTDWGSGPPVVFIHGWALGAGMWEYQTTQLAAAGLRCVAYDKRGCGRSDQPSDGYDFDTFADDLAALVEQLDLDDVTLVGHSMGCGDIARYLSRHGAGRIARTVLVGTTLPFLLKTGDNPVGVEKSNYDALVAALREDRPSFLAAGAPPFFGTPVSGAVLGWATGLFNQASPKAVIDMVPAMSETDFRDEMSAFTMPTLIVHGDQDANSPLEITGRRVAEAVPGSELRIYEGAAHGLFFTHKDRLNADLKAVVGPLRDALVLER